MRFDPGGIADGYATALRSAGDDAHGSGGGRCARPPATVFNPSGISIAAERSCQRCLGEFLGVRDSQFARDEFGKKRVAELGE
jgi:hypothetical protein